MKKQNQPKILPNTPIAKFCDLENQSTANSSTRLISIKNSLKVSSKKKTNKGSLKTIEMINKDGTKKRYPLYYDSEIGLSRKLQMIIHQTNNDDDQDTDEEQMRKSIEYCMNDLMVGLRAEMGDRFLEQYAKKRRENDEDFDFDEKSPKRLLVQHTSDRFLENESKETSNLKEIKASTSNNDENSYEDTDYQSEISDD